MKLLLAGVGILLTCLNLWLVGLYHGFMSAYSGKCDVATGAINFFGDEASRIYLYYVNGHLLVGALLSVYLLSMFIQARFRAQVVRLLIILAATTVSVLLTYYKAGFSSSEDGCRLLLKLTFDDSFLLTVGTFALLLVEGYRTFAFTRKRGFASV